MNDITAKNVPSTTWEGITCKECAPSSPHELRIICLLPSPVSVSYLAVNTQSKVFPLLSQTPAAQPRLLSLVHASGRTPLKLRHTHIHAQKKLSKYEISCEPLACEQPALVCVQATESTVMQDFFFFLSSSFFNHTSVHVEAAYTGSFILHEQCCHSLLSTSSHWMWH